MEQSSQNWGSCDKGPPPEKVCRAGVRGIVPSLREGARENGPRNSSQCGTDPVGNPIRPMREGFV